MQLNRRLLNLVGMTWYGNEGSVPEPRTLYAIDPQGSPAEPMRFEFGLDAEYTDADLVKVFSVNNDGFELIMGYPEKWCLTINRQTARRLAWFILWTWMVRTDWFGLRRWLYYRALHSVVEDSRRRAARAREAAAR
jgi:hypothetical protein